MLLPPQKGVRYVISWQSHEDNPVPSRLQEREDVEVHRLEVKGVSANRNNSLKHCKGDIVLISDDDVIYHQDTFKNIIDVHEKDNDLDLAVFKFRYAKEKPYPSETCELKVPFPKGYYGAAVEITFRREKIGDLKFWPEIGPGNRFLQSGEDEFFLISALKRGIKAKFINLEIGTHPDLTTGDRLSAGILRGQGFIIYTVYPLSSILRIPLKAIRLKKQHKVKFLDTIGELIKGALHAKKILKKIPKTYRW